MKKILIFCPNPDSRAGLYHVRYRQLNNISWTMSRNFEKTATTLLMKYHRFVFRQARRAMPIADLAEDVAQDVLVDFLGKADRWDLERDLRPLLMAMVRRSARSVWRSRAKMLPETLREIAEYIQSEFENDAEDCQRQDDRLDALRICLQKLPEPARKLITHYYFDGVSTRQLAEQMRQKADTVGKAIFRTREKLRQCIEKALKREKHDA